MNREREIPGVYEKEKERGGWSIEEVQVGEDNLFYDGTLINIVTGI